MFNCDWAQSLTRYDCRPLQSLDGLQCLEIGTPFSLVDGSAINLYLTLEWDGKRIKISDNADTLFHLYGMGIDVWSKKRFAQLRKLMQSYQMELGVQGEIFSRTIVERAAIEFAHAITGLLALSAWAARHLKAPVHEVDLLAELEPYIIARNPEGYYRRNPKIKGASSLEYIFDIQHDNDLIDVIAPNAQSTGAAMRKAGDIQNGPFAEHLSPLFVVYDLNDRGRAATEVSILGSVTRAVPASNLMLSY